MTSSTGSSCLQRTAQFADQVARRLAGELTEDEFKPLRLKNGLYLQLHAYMLRIAIPYGMLNSRAAAQARATSPATTTAATATSPRARTSSSTGRSWRTCRTSCGALADVEMHAIQTCGNCIRNITTDQYAGVARRRDRRSAAVCRDHPAVVDAASRNSAACRASSRSPSPARRRTARRCGSHDIGLIAEAQRRRRDRLRGLGRRRPGPHADARQDVREFVPEDELLAYLRRRSARLQPLGRRDNMYKARIKILVHELGEEFTRAGRGRVSRAGDSEKYRLAAGERRSASRPISPRRPSRRCPTGTRSYDQAWTATPNSRAG